LRRVFWVTYFTFNWISVELPDGRSLFSYYRALVRAVCVIKCDRSIENIVYLRSIPHPVTNCRVAAPLTALRSAPPSPRPKFGRVYACESVDNSFCVVVSYTLHFCMKPNAAEITRQKFRDSLPTHKITHVWFHPYLAFLLQYAFLIRSLC
jgi:hypothetical protein